tara:strand:- start:148 stop:729 length:582 start_codon:yes stop_codon:yes gene_type:complete
MQNNFEITEFRKLTLDDEADLSYQGAWSRVFEYPLVIKLLKKHCKEDALIHNSSWGFAGVHVLFKEKLEEEFANVENSDIKSSSLKNTYVYDITKRCEKQYMQKYDAVLNVSTMEEVRSDHTQIFNNLMEQVRPGGLFIATFDLPGLQLEKFENLFDRKLEVSGEPINGTNSPDPDNRYNHLNVGLMVLRKNL